MPRILVTFLFLLLSPALALAQSSVQLYSSYAGNVNFTGTQRTLRVSPNSLDPCTVLDEKTDVFATLSGLPAGATVLSAQLYWGGSGGKEDWAVTFEDTPLSAPVARRNALKAERRDFFGAAADVTAIVQAKGNGVYRFRDLSISTKAPYCRVEGVIGGFALMVIYSHPDETFRVLNLYEGFEAIRYASMPLTLSNFKIPSPLGSATGRVGHITWEGDATLGSTNAEDLLFNGVQMEDALNPQHNQFNSASNINGDPASHGIDFDAYTVGAPAIEGGQTTATTEYRSGQDLVLLHAEVVAVPNVPVADLAVTMVLGDAVLTLGQASIYTITASNIGPNAATGPVIVSDTFPAELTINSVEGSDWTCTVSGQLVTCSHPGEVAVGASLPPVMVSVTPNTLPADGEITNTVTVAGQSFDNIEANNSDTLVAGVAAAGYVFTDAPCVDGAAFGDPAQTCNVYPFGPRVAGTPVSGIYVTALDPRTGVPARMNRTKPVTRDIYFGLSCINPSSANGVAPTFSAQAMTACASNGTTPVGGGAAKVTFGAGAPSSDTSFTLDYADVGIVNLYMADLGSNARGSSGDIIFRPAAIVLAGITRSANGASLPATVSAGGPGFVRAGEAFSMTIAAVSSNNTVTPNFGREAVPERFSVTIARALDPATGAPYADMAPLVPDLAGSFGPVSAGSASGTAFSWPEVGILSVTPAVESGNYLGGGEVPGTSVNVGRFYADHFTTTASGKLASCSAGMGCPAGVGAVYSGQPFDVTVTARSASGSVLANYQGVFAREVSLSAWDAAGSTATPNPPASPSGAALEGNVVAASAFTAGVASVATPAYRFPNPFDAAFPRALDWVEPTTVHIRAQESADSSVSSHRASGSVEGAVRVVAGRLQASPMYGSELLNMPLPVRAQYWTGGAAGRWENSITDNVSVVVPSAANLVFSNCTGALAANCASALAPVSGTPFTLAAGAGTVRLRAPGAGNSGSAELRVSGVAWLPGTVARLVFGLYRSRLDYLREVY